MSLFAFASAKASPGSTTAALAVAAVWPAERRVLLAEADPAGGDLGPRFGLASAPGLVSLGSQRRRRLSVADVWGATQTLPGGTPVLVGPPAPEQAGALAHLWPELADVLAAVPGADILADCGRQYPESPALPLLRAAQVVVAVARPRLDEVAHLRARLAAPLTPARIEVVLMGTGPYPPEQVEQALGRKVLGVLAHDERAAAALAGQAGNARLLNRSALIRSARPVAAALASLPPTSAPEDVAGRAHLPRTGAVRPAAANADFGLEVRQ